MTTWHDYHIIPKAPLMFRDGRPFSADAAAAETLPFPRPSTLAGAMRTAWAESQDNFDYQQQGNSLLDKSVQGPLLLEFKPQQAKILFPVPADSLCLTDENGDNCIYRLSPAAINANNEGTDLPHSALQPIFLQQANNQKPTKNAATFWYLDNFEQWLLDDSTTPFSASGQGITSLPVELRTHVAINPTTQTNKTAHLFQTAGIDFSEQQHTDNAQLINRGWNNTHYGLLMRFSESMPAAYRTIGGEARLGHIQQTDNQWPVCPAELAIKLKDCKTFRLHLITPAIFEHGYLPGFIDPETLTGTLGELELTLRAAAVPRWQAGTSWDMLKGKQGKGMRKVDRLVPAGAVYWFEITTGNAAELETLWLSSISDARQADGYGLVVPGIWTTDI